MSQQSRRHQAVRDVTGSAWTYEGDWLALFDLHVVPAGDFSGRMLAWINATLGTDYPDLPGAQQAFAEDQGATNWSSLGAFTLPP